MANYSARNSHIKRRRSQGLTFRQLGEEFGVGKSTAHRINNSDRSKPVAKLTSKARESMPKSTFGLPGEKKYPMPDKTHAANAKARAAQQVNKGNLSASSKAKIDAKANKILDKDNRKGRLHSVKTDRGTFRFKVNRMGE